MSAKNKLIKNIASENAFSMNNKSIDHAVIKDSQGISFLTSYNSIYSLIKNKTDEK